jgi:YHS domain-containing protein
MNRALPIVATGLLAIFAAGCDDRSAASQRPIEIQTIENAPPRLSAIDPPPTLDDRAMPARPSSPPPAPPAGAAKHPSAQPAQPTAEEEMNAKTNLPFTPWIAMDPVDGSKVSITPETPVFSYKDRWYYFSSAANKATFRASPDTYAEGSLSKY